MDSNLPISQLDPLNNQHFTGVGNAFLPWLGPMPTLQRSDPYEKRNTAVWDMPENYKGQNLTLRDTVEELMFTANQTYLTKYIMPFYPTDQVNLQWEKFEANAHLMEMTPYQTASHSVTQKRSVRRAQLVRRGIMAEFECDFLRTAMGRVVYLAAIRQITNSVLETINQEIIQALAQGHRYQQQFLRETGIPPEQLVKRYMEDDRDRFAIVQKSKNGLEKLDLLINKEMQQYNGKGDALLIPEEIAIFATIARNEKTDFYLAGQDGPSRVNGLPGLNATANQGNLKRIEPMHMVRNTPVFIVSNLQVENVSEAESQQLTRSRQIGEYVKCVLDCNDFSEYRSEHRSFLMYNQEIDDMTKITLTNCIENCGLWEAGSGELKPAGYDQSTLTKRQDLDDDFLTFLSPGPNGTTRRLPVEHFFDIAPEYLSLKYVVGAGQTLLNAVKRRYGSEFNANIVDQATGKFYPYDNARTGNVVDVVGGILGEDRLTFGSANEFYNYLFGTGKAPVRNRTTRDGKKGKAPTFIKSKVDDAFYQLLMTKVPESKKAEIEPIIAGPGSALSKGEQIRDKIIGYIGDNVPGLKFKDEAPVHAWYQKNVAHYNDLSKNSPAESPSAPLEDGEIVGYMNRGLDLSGTEYEYIYPQSAQMPIDEIDEILPLHIMRCQEESQGDSSSASSSSRMQSAGEGMGLAGVGQFYQDTFEQRRDRNKRFKATRDRLATLKVHLKSLKQSSASDVVKAMARAWLLTRVTKDNMLRLDDNDVIVPFNFVIWRPHMQYRTRGIIKCAQNGGTGNLFIGNSSFNIGYETGRKMAQMHYTTHFRAVVTEPKNLYVQPDVYCQEIEGGAGCRFYDPESYAAMDNDHLENSLICTACPITETIFPMAMDISGRFYTDFGTGTVPRAQFERLHYSTAARYNLLYNFLRSNKNGTDVPHLGPGRNHVNRICWQGHQQNMNPKSKEYSIVITGKGHWRENATYAGCAPIRNGALEQFRENPVYVQAAH